MSELHSDKPRNPNAGLFSTIINDANNDTNRVTDSDANTHALASLKAHDKLSSDSRPPVVSDKSRANSPIGAFTESFTSSIHNMGFAGVQVVREVTGNKELLKDFKPAPVSHEANIGTGNWIAQQLGSGVAFAIPMAATAWLTRGRSVGAESSAAFSGMKAAAASGAITGFAFTPTLDNKGEAATGGAFWQKKALQTGSMAAAFATMAGVDKMHIGGHIGKAILPGSTAGIAAIGGRIAQRGLDGAIAGYSGGFVDTSIQSGFKADLGTLNESAVKWAAAGALFSGAGEGLKRSNFTGGKGKLAEAGNAAANLHEPLVKGPETPALAHVGISPELMARRNSVSPAGQESRAFSGGEGYGSRPEIVSSRGPGRQPPFRQDAPTPPNGRGMGTHGVKGGREISSGQGTAGKGERREGNSSKRLEWLAQNKVGKDGTTKSGAEQPVEAGRSTAGGAKNSGGFGRDKAVTRANNKDAAVDTRSAPEVRPAASEANASAIAKGTRSETAITAPELNSKQAAPLTDSQAIAPVTERSALLEAKPAGKDIAPLANQKTARDSSPDVAITRIEPAVRTEPKALNGVSNFGDLPAARTIVDKGVPKAEVSPTPVEVLTPNPAPVRKPNSSNLDAVAVSNVVRPEAVVATPKEVRAKQIPPATDSQAVIPQPPARPVLSAESGAKQNIGLEATQTQPKGKASESTVHVAEVVEVTTPTQSRLASAESNGVAKASDRPVSEITVNVTATPVGERIVEVPTIKNQGSGNPEMPSLSGSAISLERPFLLEGSMVSPKQVGTQLRQAAIDSIATGRQVINQAGEAFNAAKVNITDTVGRGTEALITQAQTDRALRLKAVSEKGREGSLNLAQAGRRIIDSTGMTVKKVTTFKASEIEALPSALEARKGNWDAKASELAEATQARIAGVRKEAITFASDWKQRARDTRSNLAGVEASVTAGGSSAMTKWEGKVNSGLIVDEGVRKLLEVPEGAVWSRKVEAGRTRDEVARNYLIEKGTEATNFTSNAVRFLSLQDIKLRRTLGNAVNSALDGAETFVAGGPERHAWATGRLVDFVKARVEGDVAARAKVANWFGEKLGNLRRGITDGTNQDAQSRKQLEITANELQAKSNGARPISDQVTKIRETVAPVVTERATQLQKDLMARIAEARQEWIDLKNPKTSASAAIESRVPSLPPSDAASLSVSMAPGVPKELAFMNKGRSASDLSNPITALRNDQRTLGAIKEQLMPEAKAPHVPNQLVEGGVLPETKRNNRGQETTAHAAEAMPPLRVVELRKLFSENGISQSEGGKTKNKATMLSDLKERIESGTALTEGGKPISAARTAQILEAADKA